MNVTSYSGISSSHGNLKSVCCVPFTSKKYDCKLNIKKLNTVYFQAVSQIHIDRNVIAMQTHRSKQCSKPSMNTKSSIGGKNYGGRTNKKEI